MLKGVTSQSRLLLKKRENLPVHQRSRPGFGMTGVGENCPGTRHVGGRLSSQVWGQLQHSRADKHAAMQPREVKTGESKTKAQGGAGAQTGFQREELVSGKQVCVVAEAKPSLEAAAEISRREVSSTSKACSSVMPSEGWPGASHAALVLEDAVWGEQALFKIYRTGPDVLPLCPRKLLSTYILQ